MEEIEIQSIIDRIIPELKKGDSLKRKKEEPDYYPTYSIVRDYAERISIHAQVGKFPAKLFSERSPNQEEKEFEYMKRNFKQTTLPVFMDYISTISRPFNDSNWSIKYQQEDDKYNEDTFKKYVEEEIKFYGSIENFVKNILIPNKSIDANGIIAIKPHQVNTKEDEEGRVYIDPDKLNEPIPYYYESKNIVSYEEDEYMMVMLKEKTSVEYGNSLKNIGYKFELYDKENIWHIEQYGKYIDYTFQVKIYYPHGWNKLPVIRLKGIPQLIENELIWQSQFIYVTDILDLALLNASYLEASIKTCVYPYRIMIGDACEWKDKEGNCCNSGKITNSAGLTYDCTSCNGTGLKSRISPLGTMLLKPKTRLDDGDSQFNQKPLEYVSPDVTSLEFIRQKIASDELKARQILHIHTSNSQIKGSENMTATGMAIDNKAMYAFIKNNSEQVFDIWEFIYDAIGWMRYGEDYKYPEFIRPTTWDFITEKDLTDQLQIATDNGFPPFVIHSMIYTYLDKMYFNNSNTAKIFDLIVKTDRLLTLKNEEVALKLARGTVHDWEEVLHTSAITFINELIDEDVNFLNLKIEEQKLKLIEKAKLILCNTGTCKIQDNENNFTDNLVNTLTKDNTESTVAA